MKLSTKGRYGIKAMVDIALEYGKGRLSVSQLAEKQAYIHFILLYIHYYIPIHKDLVMTSFQYSMFHPMLL